MTESGDPTEPKKKRRRRSSPRARSSSRSVREKTEKKSGEEGEGGGRRVAKWTLTLAFSALFVASGAFLFLYPAMQGPGSGRDVEIVIPGDESASALASRLASAGLVSSPRLFAMYVRLTGGVLQVARGAHLVTDDLSPRELLARLERTPAAGRVKVMIPEGWTRFDIARRLQDKRVCTLRGFLDASIDPSLLTELRIDASSFEGYLFPATYDFAPDSDPHDVVRRMKAEFDRRYTIAEQRHDSSLLDLAQALGFRMKQIVTLASMIEKEAVVDDERAVIASVFMNRLRDPAFTPKYLGCDPTAGYGCLLMPGELASCANYTGKITHDVVADPANPYNTYKHEGLPPGPICNPGLKSIEAAMQPSTTRYLYFVAKGEGRHTFSETYAAHTAAIKHP